MNKGIKKLLFIASAVLVVAILVSIFSTFFDMVGIGGGDNRVDLRIEENATLSMIVDDLDEAGIIKNKTLFKLYARVFGGVCQRGIHSFTPSMSYRQITKELEKIPQTNGYKITIPEGYELRQIADKLEESGLINREVFMREIETGDFKYPFVAEIPSRENRLEGYLFPDTYIFSGAESEHEIIDAMLANFDRIVMPVYSGVNTDKSLDEIIKLASVVEREAADDSERGKVASVFVNRIEKGMRLESCATVQYILKERKSVLSNSDTKIESPYNTYLYRGLPIGPIASPGLKSIEAAINPDDTNYLYFLANTDGTGSIFSETFEEHLNKQNSIQR